MDSEPWSIGEPSHAINLSSSDELRFARSISYTIDKTWDPGIILEGATQPSTQIGVALSNQERSTRPNHQAQSDAAVTTCGTWKPVQKFSSRNQAETLYVIYTRKPRFSNVPNLPFSEWLKTHVPTATTTVISGPAIPSTLLPTLSPLVQSVSQVPSQGPLQGSSWSSSSSSSLSTVEWPPLPSAQSKPLSSSSAPWPPALPMVSPMQPAPPPPALLVVQSVMWEPSFEPSHALISSVPFASSAASPSLPTKPPHATYHLKKRKQNRTSNDNRKHLTKDAVESFYTIACEERAHQEINNKVAGFWRNKRKKDSADDVFTAAKKKKTLDGMVEGRVPPGLNDDAIKKVKEGCDNTGTFKKNNLNLLLDKETRQGLYRDSVRKVFEATWDVAILPYQSQPTIGEAPDDGGSGSSSSTMGAGPAGPTDDAAEEFQQMDVDEIFNMVEAEAKAREQKRLRTVTVSLKGIVRQELLDMKIVRESKDESLVGPEQVTTAFAEMIRIFQEKQEILANATDEFACLGRKTTILMSQYRFSIPGQPETELEPDHLRKREVPLFDLRGSLVPSSFTPRNDINPTIPVAHLSGTLEDLVNSTPKGKDDRCLSPRGAHKKSDEDHPLWSELADELDARLGLDCMEQGWTDGDPHPMAGVTNAESSSGTPRGIALTSDDPGLCTLNTYATTTLSNVTRAIRQYSVTTRNRFELLSGVDDIVDQKPHQEQERDLAVLLPTYTGVRRGARQACREFEGGTWHLRDLRDQEIRTKRVCATLTVEQRSNAKEAVIKNLKSEVEVNNTSIDPKAPTSIPLKRDIAVVVLHGAAGTAVGSRIKGHQKRGGSKLTKEHRKYGTVAHTNENRTSRICSC
ncbi:MAG: hypothetical protein J3R72DRAFT_520738 [Linnemannia gamsii]|nr:MAG: hypothetical protein J3R72DRAFT_520738 [Linnemannia gamsii]